MLRRYAYTHFAQAAVRPNKTLMRFAYFSRERKNLIIFAQINHTFTIIRLYYYDFYFQLSDLVEDSYILLCNQLQQQMGIILGHF